MVSEIKKCFRYSFLYFFGFLFWSFLNNIEIRYNRKERKRADIANIYAVSAIIFFEVRAEADIRTSVVSSIYQVNSGVHISNHFFKGRIAAQQNRTECFHESIGLFLCFVFGLTTIIKFCIISHKSIAPALGSCIGIRPDEFIRTGLAHPVNLLTTGLSSAGLGKGRPSTTCLPVSRRSGRPYRK